MLKKTCAKWKQNGKCSLVKQTLALKGIFMLAIFLVLLSSYMYWNRPPILQFLVAQANFKSDILQNSVPTQHEA